VRELPARAAAALAAGAVSALAGALLRGLIVELGDALVAGDEDLGLRGGLPLSRAAAAAAGGRAQSAGSAFGRAATAGGSARALPARNFPPRASRAGDDDAKLDGKQEQDADDAGAGGAGPAYAKDAYD